MGQQKHDNFYITMLYFYLKNKEKHLDISLFHTCVPKTLIIWSTVSWDILCERLKLVITSHLTTLKPEKSGFWKNKDVYILLMCTSHDVFFLWYGVRLTEFFVIIAIFCPITPITNWKTKILKNIWWRT